MGRQSLFKRLASSQKSAGKSQQKSESASSAKKRAELTPAEPAAIELDRVIHERLRLGILSALAVNDSLTFNELKTLLSTTDGNLSVHARKLEEAEYVACTKSFEGRMPKTQYKMTAAGRRALERYLDDMEAIIKATRQK